MRESSKVTVEKWVKAIANDKIKALINGIGFTSFCKTGLLTMIESSFDSQTMTDCQVTLLAGAYSHAKDKIIGEMPDKAYKGFKAFAEKVAESDALDPDEVYTELSGITCKMVEEYYEC